MSTVCVCDRCRAIGVPVRAVLDVELCEMCVNDVRAVIAAAPSRKATDFALRLAEAHGSVSADHLASITGEPKRTVYFRLKGLARQGRLVALGGGVFAPVPTQEAAG